MTMPSDELHDAPPISFSEFEGITIHDALLFQKVIRGRAARLTASRGLKVKPDVVELSAIDNTLSIYIAEEVRKDEEGEIPL